MSDKIDLEKYRISKHNAIILRIYKGKSFARSLLYLISRFQEKNTSFIYATELSKWLRCDLSNTYKLLNFGVEVGLLKRTRTGGVIEFHPIYDKAKKLVMLRYREHALKRFEE